MGIGDRQRQAALGVPIGDHIHPGALLAAGHQPGRLALNPECFQAKRGHRGVLRCGRSACRVRPMGGS